MTRCGIRTCTLPEHRDAPHTLGVGAGRPSASRSVADRVQTDPAPPLPSTVRYPIIGGPPQDFGSQIIKGRTDPGYDQPGPPRRSDFSLIVIVQGIVVFLAIVLFCFLASLVEVGS